MKNSKRLLISGSKIISNWTYTKRNKYGLNPRIYEGTVQVYSHLVAFYYRLPPRIHFTQEILNYMKDKAKNQIKSQFKNHIEGELNYETEKFRVTGWWRLL